MTYDRAAREAYLDGYRVGLGDAIRAIDKIRDDFARNDAVGVILGGLAAGLRICSASAILAEDSKQ